MNWISDRRPPKEGDYWTTIEYTDEQVEFFSQLNYWAGAPEKRTVIQNYWNGSFFTYLTFGVIVAWMPIEQPDPYMGECTTRDELNNLPFGKVTIIDIGKEITNE